jgi:hypothetical protein
VVSQFTLAADTSRGNRPVFNGCVPRRRGQAGRRFCGRTYRPWHRSRTGPLRRRYESRPDQRRPGDDLAGYGGLRHDSTRFHSDPWSSLAQESHGFSIQLPWVNGIEGRNSGRHAGIEVTDGHGRRL